MDSAEAEHALIDAVAAGDMEAFERLFRLYERRVYQYIFGFVRDATVAEEVAGDTLLAVWHGAGRFEKSSRVSTWILGIARHKAIDAGRRTKRHARTESLDDTGQLPTAAAGPLDAAHDRSVAQLTRRAIENLSAEHREVLYLAFYADVPYEQIAVLLAVPQNTVKTRVYYAKQKLREQLEELNPMEAVR